VNSRQSASKRSNPTPHLLIRLTTMSMHTTVENLVSQPYKYGFVTDIETDKIAKGSAKMSSG
jgi:hypothetical protein